MVGWMSNWQYAASLPTKPWRGQMTVPRKLSLRRTTDGIRLFQQPIEGLSELRDEHIEGANQRVEEINRKFHNSDIVKAHTFELSSTMALGTAQEAGWRLLATDGSATIVGYDRRRGSVFIDRTHSGVTGFSNDFPVRTEAPLRISGGVLKLDVLVDRCSVELFGDGGRIAMTNLVFPEAGAKGIVAYANGGHAGLVSANVWSIKSTHLRPDAVRAVR